MNGVEGKRCDENDSDEVGIRKRVATVHSKSYWRQARLNLNGSLHCPQPCPTALHGCGAVAAEGASAWRPRLEPPWLWCRTSQGSLLEQLCLHFQLVSDLG